MPTAGGPAATMMGGVVQGAVGADGALGAPGVHGLPSPATDDPGTIGDGLVVPSAGP